jgi:hypothetical protein
MFCTSEKPKTEYSEQIGEHMECSGLKQIPTAQNTNKIKREKLELSAIE